jgi:hypothetical protein
MASNSTRWVWVEVAVVLPRRLSVEYLDSLWKGCPPCLDTGDQFCRAVVAPVFWTNVMVPSAGGKSASIIGPLAGTGLTAHDMHTDASPRAEYTGPQREERVW